MSRIKTFMVASVMACTLMLASATPALAHEQTYRLGDLGYGGISYGHSIVKACDTKADGKGIRTFYTLNTGFIGLVGDANGSASGCGERRVTDYPNWVTHYQVCMGANGTSEACGPVLST